MGSQVRDGLCMVLLDACTAEPVTINLSAIAPVAAININRLSPPGGIEGGDDFVHVLLLWADAQVIDTQLAERGDFVQQVVALSLHGLDAVDTEEILAFAGFQGQAFRVIQAAKLAVIFVQVVVTGSEAAGRKSQRQFAVDQDFGFDVRRPCSV